MRTIRNQYDYFQDLEKLTKAGLIAYLVLLISGLTISIYGVENTINFITTIRFCEILFLILLTINIIQLLIIGTNKIHWLGDVHLWLDNTLFRFLRKSNVIILRELLTILEPKERSVLDRLGIKERSAIAHSIFSHLAEDQSIFENLLKRGIFRSWIWYWILIYGVFVFILLTIIALTKTFFEPTIYSRALFTSIGSVTFFHLLISLLFGYNILIVTKKIIREITDIYKVEIISVLRNYIHKTEKN